MTVHNSTFFDRRAFLKASGVLAVGFSMIFHLLVRQIVERL